MDGRSLRTACPSRSSLLAAAFAWFCNAGLVAALPCPGNEPAVWKPLPADGVISESGRYFLARDVNVGRAEGIKIRADDVELDFRGRALRRTGEPQRGTFGVSAQGVARVTLRNGTIGGFWFNGHFQNLDGLRIERMTFDDIPYLAVNAARSRRVRVRDCWFEGFRYDVKKGKDAYLIALNLGTADAIISDNLFQASPPEQGTDVETVFVLFSARVSRRCLVAYNTMHATRPLPRGYGVWIASEAQATVSRNELRNLQYGVAMAKDARGLVHGNRVSVDEAASDLAASAVSASSAREVTVLDNTFQGLKTPLLLPPGSLTRGNTIRTGDE